MTENSSEPRTTGRRLRPTFIALGVVALIIVVVTLVLILAGGNKTADGTGRDNQTGVMVTNTTNSTGGPAEGSDR